MGGMTRREMLKASAIAGGVVWASPVFSTGTAWASHTCGCNEGTIIYAKFAPGNSQTCQNQCLQPLPTVSRYNFDCLVCSGLIAVCDNVSSGKGTASMRFTAGVQPIKAAIKSTSNCYVARCQEGFNKIYKWDPAFNTESYDPGLPNCSAPGSPIPCVLTDPATTEDRGPDAPAAATGPPVFRVFKNGSPFPVPSGNKCEAPTPCTGTDKTGNSIPDGQLCGSSRTLGLNPIGPCDSVITGIAMDTSLINDPLNFVEFELCVNNVSKITCAPTLC